jgi:hypothetical protein
VAGRAVRFTVTGANNTSGVATTDGSGHATVSWFGQHAGTDLVTAFADTDGNGVRGAHEVERTAGVVWRLPNPVFGRTANLEPVSGNVTVTPPGGVPFSLTDPRQVPVGSTVEATRGVMRLITARSRRGGRQAAKFFRGRFKLVQKRRRNPRNITDIVLSGGRRVRCRTGGSKAGAARTVRRRRLWGDGRGHYRTRGRHSAATVRGTRWLTEDRCDGTFTRVTRGVVVVFDFTRKKNVILRRGDSYLARGR